jgi:hypothetical protein
MAEKVEAKKRTDMINRDPFCPVRLQNVEINGKATDKFVVMMQDEAGAQQPLVGVNAVHSADYTLVPNRQVFDMISDVLTRAKAKFEPIPTFGAGHSTPTYWDGKRYSAKWFTKDVIVDGPSHAIAMGVEAINSYDGSQPVGIRFFAMHVLCANQFYIQNQLGSFIFRHVSRDAGINLTENVNDTLSMLREQAGRFVSVAGRFKELSTKRIKNFKDFLQMRSEANTKFWSPSRDSDVLDELNGTGITHTLGIPQQNQDPASLWSILNAYTAVCTHRIGGFNGSNLSDSVTQFMLNRAELKAAA